MADALDSLLSLLDLEDLEVNIFRGGSPKGDSQRVFGGQAAGTLEGLELTDDGTTFFEGLIAYLRERKS